MATTWIPTGSDDIVHGQGCGVQTSVSTSKHAAAGANDDDDDDGISLASGATQLSSASRSSNASSSSRSSASSGSSVDSGIERDHASSRRSRAESVASGSGGVGASPDVRTRNTPRRRPRSPAPLRYKQIEERRRSFVGSNWPTHLAATPEKLARAGLYFYGAPDRVKCAFCSGRLNNWLPDDLAIEEHVKHFPDCTFVQNIEKQTAVLSKNIRSKSKTANCISSEALMQEHRRERTKQQPSSEQRLWRQTLKKMGYQITIIRKAEKRLRQKDVTRNLNSVLEEIHGVEKEAFFGMRKEPEPHDTCSESDETGSSGSEDAEEHREPLGVDEQVSKLELELKGIEKERDDLHNLMLCKICLTSRADTLFLTCRHFSTCHSCADRVRDCPVCRQLILGTVDVFMS